MDIRFPNAFWAVACHKYTYLQPVWLDYLVSYTISSTRLFLYAVLFCCFVFSDSLFVPCRELNALTATLGLYEPVQISRDLCLKFLDRTWWEIVPSWNWVSVQQISKCSNELKTFFIYHDRARESRPKHVRLGWRGRGFQLASVKLGEFKTPVKIVLDWWVYRLHLCNTPCLLPCIHSLKCCFTLIQVFITQSLTCRTKAKGVTAVNSSTHYNASASV